MSSRLPPAIRFVLAEQEEHVDDRGHVRTRPHRRPVLVRYRLLLQYGYSLQVNRGDLFWQRAVRAVEARDALAHYHVSSAPSITCRALWEHLEAIALLWIVPSAKVERTIFWDQFECYEMLADLEPYLLDFEERPLHKGWPKRGHIIIPAPMDRLDDDRYPPAGTFDPALYSLRRLRNTTDGS